MRKFKGRQLYDYIIKYSVVHCCFHSSWIYARSFYQGKYQVNDFSEYLVTEIFKCVMLLLPANIAHRKGRSFSLFAIYGILLWIAAIMHSIMMSSNKVKADQKNYKACPYCGETVLKVAKKCKHCHEQI